MPSPSITPPSSILPFDLPQADEHRLAYEIGGISFGLRSTGNIALALEPVLRVFETPFGRCDVNIEISWTDRLEAPRQAARFRSGGLWSLLEDGDEYLLSFQRPIPGETPYKAAWFDRQFRKGRVLLSREFFNATQPVYPMEYPLDEVLMIHRLACGDGIEVHAVGLVDPEGRGHLFLGHSGAGKSTTARLWMKRTGIRILSDDRIILRSHHGRVWMYGTPWHGDAGVALPESAQLDGIYLLEQARKNELLPMHSGQAAVELFARSFVPHHSAQALEFALDFLDHVAREVPSSIFRFVPDQTAVEAIRRAGN